jgi:hypothetical protein
LNQKTAPIIPTTNKPKPIHKFQFIELGDSISGDNLILEFENPDERKNRLPRNPRIAVVAESFFSRDFSLSLFISLPNSPYKF